MNTTRIYAIFLRQMFLVRHNPTRFINMFLWVMIDITLWGFITKYISSVSTSASIAGALLSGIILWNFLTRVQQGVMLAFFEDVWVQNFLNLFSSPLTIKEYVLGLISTSIVTSALGLLFMLLLASIAFGYSVFVIG